MLSLYSFFCIFGKTGIKRFSLWKVGAILCVTRYSSPEIQNFSLINLKKIYRYKMIVWSGSIIHPLWFCWILSNLYRFCRVDPTAPNPGKDETPMEKALSRGNEEVFNILAEFTETPDRIKLVQLSHIMDKEEAISKTLAEFNNLLSSVPVDMVR